MRDGRRQYLMLSVSAGAGHMRAAEALRTAFMEDDPECQVTILDTFKYSSPFFEKLILGTYMEMIKHTPALYGYLYSSSEKGQPLSGYAKNEFSRLLSRFSAARLLRFIEDLNPGAVVCTHPFPLGVLSAVRRRGEFGRFTAGAVTDFHMHPYWVFSEVDLYLVGADQLAADLIEMGIPADRVHATGIPIDPVFDTTVDREAVLSGYGLNPALATILVMGGGLGLGPLAESVRELGSLGEICQIIVVTGNNIHLRERIEQMAPGLQNRICALGYVDNVHALMAASDIMVSKAGGLSCTEALARGIPLFILDPLPGQEERNSRFLTSTGAAVAAAGVDDLVGRIARCLRQPDMLKEMSRAASRVGRPGSARDAVRLIKERLNVL